MREWALDSNWRGLAECGVFGSQNQVSSQESFGEKGGNVWAARANQVIEADRVMHRGIHTQMYSQTHNAD